MNNPSIELVPALPDFNLLYLMPIIVLAAGLLVSIILNLLMPRKLYVVQISSLATVALSLVFSIINITELYMSGTSILTGGSAIGYNSNTVLVTILFGVLLSAVFALSIKGNVKERFQIPEYYFLLLLSGIGMYMMAYARDLMVMFIALELMSIPLYVLAGSGIDRARGREASLKYFLMGAFASGFLLYGMSLTYGAFGSLRYDELAKTVSINPNDHFVHIGMALVFIGFFFKLALVPFHSWAPDVYQGSPTLLSGFMAAGVKAATFVAALTLVSTAFPTLYDAYKLPVGIIAVATMVMGNLLALNQTELKRLLGYSSVTHAGYLAMGLLVPNGLAMKSMIFYLVSYTLSTFGAFVIINVVQNPGKNDVDIHQMDGFARKNPWLAMLMLVMLASLAGIPPTVGFAGKLMLFYDVIKAGYWPLAVVAVVASVVSIYYYLKVVLAMYMKDSTEHVRTFNLTTTQWLISSVCGMGSLILGIIPVAVTFLII